MVGRKVLYVEHALDEMIAGGSADVHVDVFARVENVRAVGVDALKGEMNAWRNVQVIVAIANELTLTTHILEHSRDRSIAEDDSTCSSIVWIGYRSG